MGKQQDNRLNIHEYGCMMTLVGKSRSEDDFTHVSAVGFNKNNKIIGVSYNGLQSGYKVPDWMSLPENRIKKTKYFIHAEDNLLTRLPINTCSLICLNISPCVPCCRIIVAHGVNTVVFLKKYRDFEESEDMLKFYGITVMELSQESKNNIKNYLFNVNNFLELE